MRTCVIYVRSERLGGETFDLDVGAYSDGDSFHETRSEGASDSGVLPSFRILGATRRGASTETGASLQADQRNEGIRRDKAISTLKK